MFTLLWLLKLCAVIRSRLVVLLPRSGTSQLPSTVSILGTACLPGELSIYQRQPLRPPGGASSDILSMHQLPRANQHAPEHSTRPKAGAGLRAFTSCSAAPDTHTDPISRRFHVSAFRRFDVGAYAEQGALDRVE